MIWLNTFLGNKYATWTCLIIAIANRVINMFYVSFAGRDKMVLIMQSKSLLQGNGLGLPQYFSYQLDKPVFEITMYWPPGYPVLLAPFLKIFNYDIYWATTSLDIVVCVALIFIIRKICKQIGFTNAATNIMTLIVGCFEYSFTNESQPTDTVSLIFLLLGLSFLLKLISKKKYSGLLIASTGFLLFLPSAFRYSYPPISIAIPLFVLIMGFFLRDQLLKKKGAWLFVTISLFLVAFYTFIKLYSGSAGYILETEKGIFPQNLIHWTPFIPASFFNIPFFASQAIHLTGLSLSNILIFLEVVNGIVVFSLLVYFLINLLKKRNTTSLSTFVWFLLMGSFISFLIIGSLGYLSFTNQIQSRFSNGWNYISESRYYAFIFCFIQILFISWLFNLQSILKNKLIAIIAGIGSLALFIEISHNIYFHTKVAFNYSKYKTSAYRQLDYAYFNSKFDELQKRYPGYDIITAAPTDNYYTYRAIFSGMKGIFDPNSLNEKLPVVKRNTLLILMLYDPEVSNFSQFFKKNNVTHLQHVNFSNFYLLEINP